MDVHFRYEWKKIANWFYFDQQKLLYIVSVRNRFAVLSNNVEDVPEKYKRFGQANNEAAEKLLYQLRKRRKRVDWLKLPELKWNESMYRKAFLNYQQKGDNETQSDLQDKKNDLQQLYTEIKEEQLNEIVGEVENADVNRKHRECWKLINHITGR